MEQKNEGCPGEQSQEKGKAAACEGCPNQKQCQSGEGSKVDTTVDLVKEKLSSVKNIIMVLSGKGGVGKSTIASQIALSLSQNTNVEVGLLDIDICGPSIPRMLGLEGEEVHQDEHGGLIPVYKADNLAVMSIGFLLQSSRQAVIWRGAKKNGLIQQFLTEVVWNKLDYLVIDTPPGTSDEHLTLVNYLKKANIKGAIIVTTPQEISLLDVRKEIDFCQKTQTPILGVVENMSGFVCPHCQEVTELFTPTTGGAKKMCEEFKLDLIGRIPIEPKIIEATDKGDCIMQKWPDTITAKEFKKVIDTIENKCKAN